MDIQNMLAELRQQRDQIDSAIVVLQQLALGRGKRRGRPPGWLATKKAGGTAEPAASAPKRRGRPPGSKNRKKKATAAE
ncbi:MAG: hypothetical protein SGI92_13615 [Bryobacteraceae bacterium]|nr:hypothetical protein [Bryobacteraceae bacterium]